MRTILLAAAATIALATTSIAEAKCSQSAVAGVWIVETVAKIGYKAAFTTCIINAAKSGRITDSRCYASGRGGVAKFKNDGGTVSGTITVKSNCSLSANLTNRSPRDTFKMSVSGQMRSDGTYMTGAGTFRNTAGTIGKVTISASKQW